MADREVKDESGPRGFIAAVREKLLDNIVASIAGAILAILAAITLLAWKPIKIALDERITNFKNISQDEALGIARSTIGGSTVWAAPFRNLDDDNQYIAVWYWDEDEDLCDEEKSSLPTWCDLRLGPISLDVLVGGGSTYERQPTHLTAGLRFGGTD